MHRSHEERSHREHDDRSYHHESPSRKHRSRSGSPEGRRGNAVQSEMAVKRDVQELNSGIGRGNSKNIQIKLILRETMMVIMGTCKMVMSIVDIHQQQDQPPQEGGYAYSYSLPPIFHCAGGTGALFCHMECFLHLPTPCFK
ncbi:hypothetical protein SESBI_46472 [Sesbania bispinosa]|nr:hypothetical protein SESBI_46472 [Sesbania bispinosa]